MHQGIPRDFANRPPKELALPFVFHRAAAEMHRASMSEWLARRMMNADQLAGRIYIQLNYQGSVNFDIFRSHFYSDLPRYSVAFAPQNEPLVT